MFWKAVRNELSLPWASSGYFKLVGALLNIIPIDNGNFQLSNLKSLQNMLETSFIDYTSKDIEEVLLREIVDLRLAVFILKQKEDKLKSGDEDKLLDLPQFVDSADLEDFQTFIVERSAEVFDFMERQRGDYLKILEILTKDIKGVLLLIYEEILRLSKVVSINIRQEVH